MGMGLAVGSGVDKSKVVEGVEEGRDVDGEVVVHVV